MRWLRPSILLLCLAVLGIATFVSADYGVLDKGSHFVGAQGQRTNSTGDLRVDDMSRDRNNWRLIPLINNQLTASSTGMVDSNATPVATYDLSRMNLLLSGTFDSLSTIVRLAVQVRGHWGTQHDSATTYPWYPWPQRNQVGPTITPAAVCVAASGNTVLHTAAAASSLGLFASVPIGYLIIGPGIPVGTYVVSKGTSDSALTMSAATTAIIPASSSVSFVPPGSVLAQGSVNGYTAPDSIGHLTVGSHVLAQQTIANSPFPNATGAWSGEFVVKFNVARQDTTDGIAGVGKYGAMPITMMIPLSDASGAWFNAPYTSVRVRVLNGVRSRFKVKADLMGVSK